MATATRLHPASIEQFLSFEAPPGYRDELIEGEIVLSPEPKPLHQEIAHRICRALENQLAGSGFVARQRTNMLMRADASMPSPDVFVMDKARWRAAIQSNGYPSDSPQLAVEVVSPGNRKKRIFQKTRLYLRNGASAVWVVYPRRQQVEVWMGSQTEASAILYGDRGDAIQLSPPLPNRTIDLLDVFDLESGE